MWKRYNQTTHIWEKSVDNGQSWSQLPLSGASITEGTIPNVAYKNTDNNFPAQTLGSGTTIRGNGSMLFFHEPGAPVGSKYWRFVNYAANDFRLEILNDAGSAVIQTPFSATTNGDLSVTRYTFSGQGYFEYGRSAIQGGWLPVAFNAANFSADQGMTITIGSSQVAPNQYALIGKTLFWNIGMNNFTLGGTNGNVQLTMPAGLVSGVTGTVGVFVITNNLSGVGWKIAMVSATAGSNKLGLIHLPNFVWTAGDAQNWAYLNVNLQIQ